jgi:hypothetical protein
MIGRIVHAMTNCTAGSQMSMAPENAANPRHGVGRSYVGQTKNPARRGRTFVEPLH